DGAGALTYRFSMRANRTPTRPAAPPLTVALIEASSGTLLPRPSYACANINQRLAVRIAGKAHIITAHSTEADKSMLAHFVEQCFSGHCGEANVPDAGGLVIGRCDDTRPVWAEN